MHFKVIITYITVVPVKDSRRLLTMGILPPSPIYLLDKGWWFILEVVGVSKFPFFVSDGFFGIFVPLLLLNFSTSLCFGVLVR